jgi:hypothetical protein
MSRIRQIVPVLAALAALALPAPAAASYEDVIKDCAYDGKFDQHWNHQDLTDAHQNLPTDIREYTDCKALIEAELAKGGGGGGPGGGPGTTASGAAGGLASGGGGGGALAHAAVTASGAAGTPDAVRALDRATHEARKAKPTVEEEGEAVIPAASSLDRVRGSANGLPSALVLAILSVAVLGTLGGTAAGWRRWPALLRAPLRLFRR